MGRFVCAVAAAYLVFPVCAALSAAGSASTPTSRITAAVPAKTEPQRTDTAAVFSGYRKEIQLFALSLDGRLALTGDEDENNYLWDMRTGTVLREIGQPDAVRIPLTVAAFSPDGSTILWSRFKKTTPVLWDASSGKRLAVLPAKAKGHDAEITTLDFSFDGRYMASGDQSGVVCLWSRKDKVVLRRYQAHTGSAEHLAFIPGSSEFVTSGADGAIRLWSVDHSGEVALLKAPGEGVTAITVALDGAVAYAAISDGTIRSWNLPLRTLRGSFVFDERQINGIELSPDGDLLAIVGENAALSLWNLRESKLVWQKELDDSALQARFTPDGRNIITAGGDNWVRVWNSANGNLVRRFAGAPE